MADAHLLLKKLKHFHKKKVSAKDRFLLVIVTVGIFLLIFFLAYFLWNAYTQRSMAHYLPANRTVAYVEADGLSLPTKLQANAYFNQENLAAFLGGFMGVDFASARASWAGDRFGVALLTGAEGNSEPVLILRPDNKGKAMDFFRSLTLPEETLAKEYGPAYPIYSYPQGQTFYFSFIGPYVFIAHDVSFLMSVQDTLSQKGASLYDQSDFQKTISHLPRQYWISGYVNVPLLEFPEGNPVNQVVRPLQLVINHAAFTLRQDSNGFFINIFTNLNPALLPDGKGFSDDTRFVYQMTEFLDAKGLALYAGGANLTEEWQNTLSTISRINPAYGIILEGVLRAQVTKIFGDGVDLRNDLYPLFQGEYALAVGVSDNDQLDVRLLLQHSDPDFAKVKLDKLSKGFRLLAAHFAPKLSIITLPDGTESREMIADSSRLDEETEEYEGQEIHCLEVKKSNYGFCYAVLDSLIVMANSRAAVTDTIDLSLHGGASLSRHLPFRQTLSQLSRVSDEITFMDIPQITELLSTNPIVSTLSPVLSAFDGLTWVKHYFDDGVAVEGYLLIR